MSPVSKYTQWDRDNRPPKRGGCFPVTLIFLALLAAALIWGFYKIASNPIP